MWMVQWVGARLGRLTPPASVSAGRGVCLGRMDLGWPSGSCCMLVTQPRLLPVGAWCVVFAVFCCTRLFAWLVTVDRPATRQASQCLDWLLWLARRGLQPWMCKACVAAQLFHAAAAPVTPGLMMCFVRLLQGVQACWWLPL
jgi:hypothetical protein